AQADTTTPSIRLRFDQPPLALQQPAALRAPWLGAPRLPPPVRAAAWDSTLARGLDSSRVERAVSLRYSILYGRRFDTPDESQTAPTQSVLGISRTYADLGIDGQVRLEIRTDRLRNERCSSISLFDPSSGCHGGFKAPKLDNHVNLRSTGLIGRRVHLNVDYDNDRDFTANNNVQVYYEGLEDEIVRRIEVGTVTFQPPRSRFITAAIPANNFGVNARFEVGAFQFQTLAATQKGSQVTERVYNVGQTTSQSQDRRLRDLDFESGRFFWVVDPTTMPGYPALDILDLSSVSVPASQRPAQIRVYRFRPSVNQSTINSNLGGITAVARTTDPAQIYGPVQWELLVQGTDFYVDPSGLWLALSTKLDQVDYLAVSYTTADGGTVGSFPSTDKGPGSTDSLRLIVQPRTGPEAVTFRNEMRQIYRVAGEDLDPASLQVNLLVNQSERPQSGAATYLSLLGLSIPTDPNLVDRDNRLFPRARDPEAAQIFRESYLIFPHLTPFADATRLTPAERADSMYRTPLYSLLQQTSAKFQLRLRYNSTGSGDRSTLNLGGLQLREGSEVLTARGRRLERGVDYNISYELGKVTFLNPDALFGSSDAEVSARFEEQGLFAVAPTTILGLATTYSLGEVGALNLIGLYQREQSAFNRPALGFEASANLVGGVNGELHFKPSGVTRLLNGLTSSAATAPSLLDVNAEFAFTKPDPNRSGQAYLEEFEQDAGTQVSLTESNWEFGSRPQEGIGLEDAGFGGGFDDADAVALTWQNLVPTASNAALELRPQDIDTLIRTTGGVQQRETALFFTLHADTAGGVVQRNRSSHWTLPRRDFRPRWRSIVTSLSATGVDLSRNEYLEFWVFQLGAQPGTRTIDSAGVRVVLDLGTVNEDAEAIAPDSLDIVGADTIYTGRQMVGVGRLDTERRVVGTFNAQVDDIGILGDRPDNMTDVATGEQVGEVPLCQRILSAAVPIFPWGDLSSRCTRGNGTLDTEDLNGDNGLNSAGANENVFRYVVSLQPGGKYFVRDGVQTVDNQQQVTGKWELYRVPIRTPDAQIGTPNLRLIQQLRLTVVAPPDPGLPDVVARFALARLRFVGSPWIRRAERPIAGLSGSIAKPAGDIVASVVSTENRIDLGYEPPPGVVEGVDDRGRITSAGVQINEKSLRVIATQLELGDRAEAYLRFPAGPQNVLAYRELRAWMRGRGPGWEERDVEAFLKFGSDDRNFYLYHVPAHSNSWEPELVADLETWRRLRAQIETRWLSGEQPSGAAECGGDPNAYVACAGAYLVQVADPGINPPNLAAVQEVSAGIYRVGGSASTLDAELWVDDIRLASPVSQTGTAMTMDVRLTASDVGNIRAAYTRQDGQFRQINSDPTYRTTGTLQLGSDWRLDRFLPPSLGLLMPVGVTYVRTDEQPELLAGTDLRGSALEGLRTPSSWSATYSLALRRGSRGRSWLVRGFIDPLALSTSLTQGRSGNEFSDVRASALNVNLTYLLQSRRRGFRLPFTGLVKGLPKWLRESDAGKGLRDASFSLAPSIIRMSSGLTRNEADNFSFGVPIVRPSDVFVQPNLSLTHLWRNSGGLTWQPLGMLTLSGDLASTRDLRVYPDSTSLGRVAYASREFLLGIPVGVERDRTLSISMAVQPKVSSWLRPRLVATSGFVLSRTLNTRPLIRADGDSGEFILPKTINNQRSREIGTALDVSRALRGIFGDSSRIGRAFARARPIDVSRKTTLTSTFDLAAFEPGFEYMLALGGLGRFLAQEGVPALSTSESRTTTLATGADLPFGLAGTLSYALTTSIRYQLVGNRPIQTSTRQREWPVGNVRWTRSFNAGPITIVALGLGFRHREGSSDQPSVNETGVASATNSTSLTPDLQLILHNGMSFALGYTDLAQETQSSGNAIRLDQNDLSGSFSYAFRLPPSLGRSRRQVRSSVTGLSTKTQTCLVRGGGLDCTVSSDVRRKELRGGLDTDIGKTLSAGLQFGYSLSDERHLSRRTSQIFLLASFQLSLNAGNY
ncbi:MAG: cell surface protein SprA, partial [Gemmatimonadales bacterium]